MSQVGEPDPYLRASDADRERIVEQLRQHTTDGRLSMDEFEQRMSAAYAAKTYGELAELTRDLPVDLGARSAGAGAGMPAGQAGPFGGGWSGPGPGRTRPGQHNEVVDALIGAAMDWKLQKHQMHEQIRAQRGQMRLVRRANQPIAAGFAGWAFLSVLLTGIWFFAGVTSGSFSDFWPIWPIGIVGILTAAKTVKTVALRREMSGRR